MLTLETSIEAAVREYRLGHFQEAEKQLYEILQENPNCLEVLTLLASISEKYHQFDRAEMLYQKILEIKPDRAITYGALGDLYLFRCHNRISDAIEAYKQALSLDLPPNLQVVTYTYLGIAFINSGQITKAVTAYQNLIKLQPDNASGYYNLGIAFAKLSQREEATWAYQKAIDLEPKHYKAYHNLGNLFKERGMQPEAITFYEKSLEIQPNFDRSRMGILTTTIPIIYTSETEIEKSRQNYSQYLQNLAERYQNATARDRTIYADCVGTSQPFYLAYQGLNDRHLQQIYGNAIAPLMQARYPQWSQPPSLPPLRENEKIRVGIFSAFLHNHSNWKIPIKGWVENLDKRRFELYGYYGDCKADKQTQLAARSFVKLARGNRSVEQWGREITADRLHVLIFPEFGMNPVTLQLGCLRLAPIQMTSWGHPQTSGLPTIDYYLSSDLMEPENAADCYTEEVVRLPNLSIFYTPVEVQPTPVRRSDIGMSDDDVMFWCCQSSYKYLPQHDDVFPRIARELPNAKFAFIQYARGQYVTEIFYQRLKEAFAQFGLDSTQYCVFLPRMKARTFAGVNAIADVFLDSIGWSGCNSTLESLTHNLPIVTLPGDLMRGRHTLAILKMMGLDETIATSKEEYIEMAVRLGRDSQYRRAISEKVAANKHRVYEDLAPIRALEDFLTRTARQKIGYERLVRNEEPKRR
ncbi:MAG: tetratricopeptide repeat protein [Cyanobacteriota bacterium]|nr:tetratricopeptide repeat protein [Cyanobacteriota bacterium]